MRTTPEAIRRVGGAPCLDFVNTTEWTGPGRLLGGEEPRATARAAESPAVRRPAAGG
jgi:hypothetical protein